MQGYANLLQVYKFDNASGTFSPKFELSHDNNYNPTEYPHTFKYFAHSYEFSADSKNIFIVEEDVQATGDTEQIHYASLLKYNLTARNNEEFQASSVKLHDFPGANYGNVGSMQLSSDGRILIGSHQDFVSAINLPDAETDLSFTYKAIIFEDWPGLIPTFPAFYFSNCRSTSTIETKDIVACPGSSVSLEAIPDNPEYQYKWTNSKNSEILFGATPVVTIPEKALSAPDTTYYYLDAEDPAGCHHYASLRLITLPSRELPITGSPSVCPGIEEVAYWIADAAGNSSFDWQVEGGEIVAGQGTERILVNWGGPKQDAAVKLTSINSWGCKDFIPDFKVKIFKELDTEKPNGRDTLFCENQLYDYHILATNGSVYNWQVLNGEILEGQGTSQVKVSWNAASPQGYLWIEENVNADLETCFGRSDTLVVINPAAYGNLNAELQLVTGIPGSPEVLQLRYEIQNQQFFEEVLTLLRKEVDDERGVWKEIASISLREKEVTLNQPLFGEVVFDYKIRGFNRCGTQVESVVHNNIVLSGKIASENQQLQLAWNPYQGWSAGVKAYELYRKLDEAQEYVLLTTLKDQIAISLDNLSEGIDHCFYIKAIPEDDQYYPSFSNEFCLSYDHPILIPNVITPNGDKKNEFLVISMLELYHENELRIFNRHGKLLYQKKNYTNDWNAAGLPNGIYYYHFTTLKNKKSLKGWIQILR